jgi:hypothetical protein
MMKDFITSKEIVEMFVIMLLDGKSGKVAVQKDENSPTEFKQMSILTQFLNPNMKRKCMTNSIKDTLVRTTKLLLKNEANANKTNVYDKVLLFIFSLTGIDLSYIDIYYGHL